MTSIGAALAAWAHRLDPAPDELALADAARNDTVAVALAAHEEPLRATAELLPEAGRWAAMAHVLDFDDLHMESTAHISAVCVPAVLACDGDARAYLAAAGVMARLGTALGWGHYAAGWHATCTTGAPAAAVGAALSLGLDADRTAAAIALALPAAGGVQRAFGTDAKPLQVGFAADAGVRAARLAAAGAEADPAAVDQWLDLMGADVAGLLGALTEETAGDHSPAALPAGLAVKIHPCCYALQRPITATRLALSQGPARPASDIERIRVRTLAGTVQPLIHHRPETGAQAKFSLEYAVAAAVLDVHPGFASFTTEGAARPSARRLVSVVEPELTPGGDGLLDGTCVIEVVYADGEVRRAELDLPPGSPGRPASVAELDAKYRDCGAGFPTLLDGLTWPEATRLLRTAFPSAGPPDTAPDSAPGANTATDTTDGAASPQGAHA